MIISEIVTTCVMGKMYKPTQTKFAYPIASPIGVECCFYWGHNASMHPKSPLPVRIRVCSSTYYTTAAVLLHRANLGHLV